MRPYAAIMVNASFEYLKVGVLFMNTILVSLLIIFIDFKYFVLYIKLLILR